METLTKEQLAERLNNRQYRKEITAEEIEIAKQNGLVVIFGASDDLCEICGAINEEINVDSYHVIDFNKDGIVKKWDDIDHEDEEACRKYFESEKPNANVWSVTSYFGTYHYTFTYETKIPHTTFEILEDEDPYCRGIVFNIIDLN